MELTPFRKNAGSPSCAVGNVLQNGVRIEKHHSLLLRLSCIDIVKTSDWDLKQSIRKLDPTCSVPLLERIDRVIPKRGVELHLIYENSSSMQLISSKIELLMNKVKANSRLLNVEVISGLPENTCTKAKKVLQAVWLRNLPIRWFQLDTLAVSCVVPNTHILRTFMSDTFGEILQMETRNQNSEKENFLRCDVCIQFAGDDGRNKMMNTMSDGSCVARKEGSDAAFPITAEFDLEGYFDIRLIDQRIALRESLIAAQKMENKEVEHFKKAVSDAEVDLNSTDVLGLLDVVAFRDTHEELKMLCTSSTALERNALSAHKGDLEDQILMSKQQCKALRAASFSISSKAQALMQLLRAEQANRKLIAQREAAELIQMHIRELQSSARHSVDFALEISRLGKELCMQNYWENVPQKLFPRMDILTNNLSHLLKKESGGEKFASMLQKSQLQLEECIAYTAPIVTHLEQYNDLSEAIKRAQNSMSIDEECDPSISEERSSYPVADTARECVKSLIRKGTESTRTFLSSISEFETDNNSVVSKENKDKEKEREKDKEKEKDTDGDTVQIECTEKGVAGLAHAIDVLRGVHARLLDAELTTHTLVDSFGVRADADAEGSDESPSTREETFILTSTLSSTIAATSTGELADTPHSFVLESSLSHALLSPPFTAGVGAKKGRSVCLCFKGSCICDSEELKQLHGLYRIEIADPFELRISRISNMLRSPLEAVVAPSFLTNLKNSVETACALSLIGAREYEQDREALMKEADLIRAEEDREKIRQQQVAEENVKRVKAEQRALLERKIAALKSRKRELEEIEEEKNRKDIVEAVSANQVDHHECLEGDVNHSTGVHTNTSMNRTVSRMDSERGRERDSERGRERERVVRRDSYEDPFERYSDGLERQQQARETECEKGEYVYTLLAPSWDTENPADSTTPDNGVASDPRDRKSGRSFSGASSSSRNRNNDDIENDVIATNGNIDGGVCGVKRCRMHSVVGCVVADTDSGILSATRRRLNLTGIFSSSGGNYRESESAPDIDIEVDTCVSQVESNVTADVAELPLADQNTEVEAEVHSEDSAHTASASVTDISQQNKKESTLREALLASKLKKRLSARMK